ncbi:hypothetical protein GBAR_LOCUS3186 [Geodia barretti]|uniref:Uncharacterized protein n=1 Tax=Geodia barretti TaxID=519541 RepID=A0AA35R3W5_GEOBA|nr:hypothetical protein GBAR_LOCUS3186 [Geodia barretti]
MSYISAHLGRLTTGHAYFYSYIIRPYVTCTFGNKFWKPCFIKCLFLGRASKFSRCSIG